MIQKSNRKPTKLDLDEVNMAILKYKNHWNIKTITNRMATFSFDFICHAEVETVKAIHKLCNKKASQNTDITVKNIKGNKRSNVTFFTSHQNCWPICILWNSSKIYERLMYNQISVF